SGGMSLKPPGSILATIKPVLLSDIIVTADWTKFSMVLAVAVQGIPAAEAIPSRSTRPLVCVGGQPTTPSYRSLSSTIIVKLGGDSLPTLQSAPRLKSMPPSVSRPTTRRCGRFSATPNENGVAQP